MILHRLGHSKSYNFGFELETLLAMDLDEVSTSLMLQILTADGNIIFHCEWDDLKKTTTKCIAAALSIVLGESWCRRSCLDSREPRSKCCLSLTSCTHRSLKVGTPETLPSFCTSMASSQYFPMAQSLQQRSLS